MPQQSRFGPRSSRCRSPGPVLPQAVPEHLDAVEHLRRAGEEALLVEARRGERLGQLVGGVGGVLVLDLVVPRPERQVEGEPLALLEGGQPGDELLPEPGGGPVLDGVKMFWDGLWKDRAKGAAA